MLRKIITLVVLVPLGIVLIVLSVTNRQSVTLALNPFRPEDQVLSLTAPFFVFLFVALMIGLLAGSFATWLSQGKHRKRARVEKKTALKWQAEADKHKNRAEQIAVQALPSPQSK
ncbi:DUF1049 domain-containing protein [Ciceribacter sp. L1K23]|uniref:DUF1049 domain-containing protein n=1 Tax=unclassified Ciceribacter TaxID=2628820 RepID=UPI001ABE0DB8|nr:MULTISPECIES: DUF1049 domain-containing protein [unclassified Ciceribacter]MBO3758792.1 DUF1049 domain-containing protein [Ciceribacter sp. L1K22]MBR0557200.1 DUF1049 domain-containing protein [Ciceribacter sp. L1K23]